MTGKLFLRRKKGRKEKKIEREEGGGREKDKNRQTNLKMLVLTQKKRCSAVENASSTITQIKTEKKNKGKITMTKIKLAKQLFQCKAKQNTQPQIICIVRIAIQT